MGIMSAIARELVAAGVEGSDLIAALERLESEVIAARDPAADRRRAADRERKRLIRADAAAMSAESAESADTVSPKEIPRTPLEITPSTSLRSDTKNTGRASRIPEDFVPEMDAAYEAGLSEAETLIEVANFLDYWRAKATNATKRDWPATWRVWCRKAANDRGSHQGRAPPRQRSQNGFAAYALELAAEQENGSGTYQNGFHTADDAGLRPGGREAPASDRILDAERSDKAG